VTADNVYFVALELHHRFTGWFGSDEHNGKCKENNTTIFFHSPKWSEPYS